MPNILEDFDEKFIYDYFDSTGLQILGLREANRPATDDEVTAYISDKIRQLLSTLESRLTEIDLTPDSPNLTIPLVDLMRLERELLSGLERKNIA